jgi:DNA-binding transcriptional LysR family regulator
VPLTPEDLSQYDCLINVLKSPTNFWTLTGLGGKRSVRASGSMRSNFGEPLRYAALLDQGISMHPNYMGVRDIRENVLRVVLPAYQPGQLDIYAVYTSQRNMPGRVRLFLEFLRERFQNTTKWQTEVNLEKR